MGTTSIIGRLKLIHPDLGYEGGVALEGHIKSTLQKTSDAINSRYFEALNLANAASADFEHNFKCAFSELRINAYAVGVGGELTRLVSGGSPDLDDFAIIAKPGALTTEIRITNNTGSEQDVALVVIHGKGAEVLNDLGDVDTTGKEDGQALVYSNALSKFVPGASGDSSFKLQKLTGSVLTIKKGYMILSTGEELYAAADLEPDLATAIPGANATYYLYFDRLSLPSASLVSGRKLIAVGTSNISYQTTTPDDVNLSRYIPFGKVVKSGGTFSSIETLAMRRHDVALGTDASLEYTKTLQAIGSVGSANQIAAGHELASGSFPAAAVGANLSWYGLADMLDGSGNARTLTNNNAATFTTDILGQASKCVSLASASSQYLSSPNTLFDPGDVDFCAGGWFKPSNWAAAGVQSLFSQWVSAGNLSYLVLLNAGSIYIYGSSNGTAYTNSGYSVSTFTGWHHVALKYVASSNTLYLYVDARQVASLVLSGNLYNVGASRQFNIGRDASTGNYFNGQIDEFFFAQYALSDNDIAKIYASKLTHSRTLAPVSQKWVFTGVSADGQARELFDNIVDMDANDLYFDLSDELSTTQCELKLYNISSMGSGKAAKARTLELTAADLDALLPISHGLGVVPEISLKVKNGSNDYEYHDAGSVFVATATQVKLAGDTLTTLYGASTVLVLTYATATMAQQVPNRFWNNVTTTSAIALSANDRIFANTVGGAIAGTLPASPSIGDEIQVCDSKGNFGVNAFTFGRNGQNIMGSAADFIANISHKMYRAVYVDSTYGWAIYY